MALKAPILLVVAWHAPAIRERFVATVVTIQCIKFRKETLNKADVLSSNKLITQDESKNHFFLLYISQKIPVHYKYIESIISFFS